MTRSKARRVESSFLMTTYHVPARSEVKTSGSGLQETLFSATETLTSEDSFKARSSTFWSFLGKIRSKVTFKLLNRSLENEGEQVIGLGLQADPSSENCGVTVPINGASNVVDPLSG